MSRLRLRLGLDRPLALPRGRTRIGGDVLIDRLGVGGLVREIGGDRPRTGVSQLQVIELGFGRLERDRFDLVQHHGRLELDGLGLIDHRLRFVGHRFGRQRSRASAAIGGSASSASASAAPASSSATSTGSAGSTSRGNERSASSAAASAASAAPASVPPGRSAGLRVLGSGERLGEALGGPARAAAPAAMRLLVLRFARGIGHRWRLRRPWRRRVCPSAGGSRCAPRAGPPASAATPPRRAIRRGPAAPVHSARSGCGTRSAARGTATALGSGPVPIARSRVHR